MPVSKITTDELVAVFGPRIPMDAVALLQTAPDDVGIDRIRELLLEIKEARDREEGTAAVTVPQELRDELRRLQRALDSETGNRINLGQRLSVANKRIDQLMAANSAAEVKLSQAKDALAAAEAERDRFNAAADAYAQFAYATDAELEAAGTTRLDVLKRATKLERGPSASPGAAP